MVNLKSAFLLLIIFSSTLASCDAIARNLAAGEVNGEGPEIFMALPRVLPGDIPHGCKLSQARVTASTQFTNHHANALRRWGTVHFHIPGGCSDWDFVIAKWQEAIGSPVTEVASSQDLAALDSQVKAARPAVPTGYGQRTAPPIQSQEPNGAAPGMCLFSVCLGDVISLPACAREPGPIEGCVLVVDSGKQALIKYPYSAGPEMLIAPSQMSKPSMRATFGENRIVERLSFIGNRSERTLEQFQSKFGAPSTETMQRQSANGRTFNDKIYTWNVDRSRLTLNCSDVCYGTATTGKLEEIEKARPSKGRKL